MLRAGLVSLLLVAACSAPTTTTPDAHSGDSKPAKTDKKTGDNTKTPSADPDPAPVAVADGKVALYQQMPIDVFRLGAAEAHGTFEGTPICVTGDVNVNTTLAKTFLHDMTPSTANATDFGIRALPGQGLQIPLDQVQRFQTAVLDAPTRVAGTAEILVYANSFELVNGVKSSTDDSCGTRFASSALSARFLAIGLRIEFAKEADKAAYVTQFKDITALTNGDPNLPDFFAKHADAKISTHVLVSNGQMSIINDQLKATSCSTTDLASCQSSFQKWGTLAGQFPTMPGPDDSIDDLTEPGAAFGVYDVVVTNYSDL